MHRKNSANRVFGKCAMTLEKDVFLYPTTSCHLAEEMKTKLKPVKEKTKSPIVKRGKLTTKKVNCEGCCKPHDLNMHVQHFK